MTRHTTTYDPVTEAERVVRQAAILAADEHATTAYCREWQARRDARRARRQQRLDRALILACAVPVLAVTVAAPAVAWVDLLRRVFA